MTPPTVAMLNLEWHDAARERRVPVRIYYPETGGDRLPVIVFSHGVGGTRGGYSFLGSHWASQGYVCVHPEHLGSNAAVWQAERDPMAALRNAATDKANAVNRVGDVRFTIDQLTPLQETPGPLQGRLDLARVGAAGHSFGAATTLGAVGQRIPDAEGREHLLVDARIRAAVVLSPSAPRHKDRLGPLYAAIRVPILHITGTLDESPIGLTSAVERRTAFDHIDSADQYLAIFRDADHMTFTDVKRSRLGRERQAAVHPLVQTITTLFWDAFLRDDRRADLAQRLQDVVGDAGTLESKNPKLK
jgi:predicted dienelactone hydrolase